MKKQEVIDLASRRGLCVYEQYKYYKALYDQAGNSIAVPIFESIFRKIILHEVA